MRINVYFKVLAVVLAVFVWFLARKSGEPIQMSFYAPVVFKNISPSFQVTSDPPQVNIVVYTNSRISFECATVLVRKWKQRGWDINDRKVLECRETLEEIARLMTQGNVQVRHDDSVSLAR